MALRFDVEDLSRIELIAERDDALEEEGTDYEKYIETRDRSHLKLKPNMQPTIFVLNFAHKGRAATAIKNAMMANKDGKGTPTVAYGSWTYEIVRQSLKDIVHPADYENGITIKTGKDGLPSDDFIAQLDKYGVVADIFNIYNQVVSKSARAEAKNS